jgi:hypothetical protein
METPIPVAPTTVGSQQREQIRQPVEAGDLQDLVRAVATELKRQLQAARLGYSVSLANQQGASTATVQGIASE